MGSCQNKKDNGTHDANCPCGRVEITEFAQMKDPLSATTGTNAQLTSTGRADGHCFISVTEHLSETCFP